MVKGVNRQMIVLKLDGNRIYDSACFVLKNDAKQQKEAQKDMLREANRILAQMDIKRSRPRRIGWFWKLLFLLLILVIGMIIGFALSFLL